MPFHNFNLNLFVTFVADMMKYILSILLCIFFAWGLSDATPEKDSTKPRSEVSATVISQFTEHLPLFNDETSVDFKLSDCILSQISSAKESGSFKTLKLRQFSAVRLPDNFRTVRSEENYKSRSFNGNFIRYSCGYYVYTLKHILI